MAGNERIDLSKTPLEKLREIAAGIQKIAEENPPEKPGEENVGNYSGINAFYAQIIEEIEKKEDQH